MFKFNIFNQNKNYLPFGKFNVEIEDDGLKEAINSFYNDINSLTKLSHINPNFVIEYFLAILNRTELENRDYTEVLDLLRKRIKKLPPITHFVVEGFRRIAHGVIQVYVQQKHKSGDSYKVSYVLVKENGVWSFENLVFNLKGTIGWKEYMDVKGRKAILYCIDYDDSVNYPFFSRGVCTLLLTYDLSANYEDNEMVYLEGFRETRFRFSDSFHHNVIRISKI